MNISCITPTTAKRRWCLPLAIKCFQNQTYPANQRELVVVFDGPGSIDDLIPKDDPSIRLVQLSGDRALGDKFNAAVRSARFDRVALWDDDDWHSPSRLAASWAALRDKNAAIAGATSILFHELCPPRNTYMYRYQDSRPWLAGGTLVFDKALAQRYPFDPDRARGHDTAFVWRVLEAGARSAVLAPFHYVAMVHGGNTGRAVWPPPPSEPAYQRFNSGITALMGQDALARYEAAFVARGESV